jgi:(p)ppGpp synthase/HD superfamily hydrolase
MMLRVVFISSFKTFFVEVTNNMILVYKAQAFAHAAHDSTKQVRKYSGLPYWVHTDEVAEIVSSVTNDPEIIAAAHLHDVLEDVNIPPYTAEDILNQFGRRVLSFVEDLTDVYVKENYPDFNRSQRKELESIRLSKIRPDSQTIKYCDFLSNTADIISNDPGFAKVYLREKQAILRIMNKGNQELYQRAFAQVTV